MIFNMEEYEPLKKVVFNYYDKLKLQGKKPRVDDPVVKAILTGFDNEVIKMIFIDYFGGMDNVISNLSRITKNKVFNTDDYADVVNMGSYSFRFMMEILDGSDWGEDITVLAHIMDGELTLINSGEHIDFNDLGDDRYEDILWEITDEIGDRVSAIYSKIHKPYNGLSFNISVDYI